MMQKHKKVQNKGFKRSQREEGAANHEKGMLKNRTMAKALQNSLKSIVDEVDTSLKEHPIVVHPT